MYTARAGVRIKGAGAVARICSSELREPEGKFRTEKKHETREPLDVILSLERLKPPTSTNDMLGVHAAFKALGARVCFPHT